MYLYTYTPITSLRDNRSVVLIYTVVDDDEEIAERGGEEILK